MTAYRRFAAGRAARGSVAVCLLLLGAMAASALISGSPFASAVGADTSVPYTDPNAVGSIGLCNQAGQQITSGSVTARPFAWRAVSTQPAQTPYNGAGRTAILVGYQPLEGLPPGDWSGTQLTASSRYTNPANPMAAATDGDLSLDDVIEQYAPKWDGFLQLRIYLGAPQESGYTSQYPALDIQVTGDSWKAVGGSQVNCASGTSVSIESVLLPSSATSPSTSVPSTTSTTADGVSAESQGGSGGSTAGPDSDRVRSEAGHGRYSTCLRHIRGRKPQGKGFPVLFAVGLAVLVFLAAVGSLFLRRRHLASRDSGVGTDSRSLSSTSVKGDSP